MIQGIFLDFAARTTGTATNPPFEKTTSGLILSINDFASDNPLITLKGSEKFFRLKYLLNLPVAIP